MLQFLMSKMGTTLLRVKGIRLMKKGDLNLKNSRILVSVGKKNPLRGTWEFLGD